MVEIRITNGMRIEQLASTALVSIFGVFMLSLDLFNHEMLNKESF